MKNFILLLTGLYGLLAGSSATCQITKADYTRAESFYRKNVSKKIFHLEIQPHWLTDGTGFWYQTNTREGEQYYKVSIPGYQRTLAFDHQKLAQALSGVAGKTITAQSLAIKDLEWKSATQITFQVESKRYQTDLQTYQIVSAPVTPKTSREENRITSPDGNWVTFTQNHNMYLQSTKGGEPIALTKDGYDNYAYGEYLSWNDILEGECQARPVHLTASWSPDSKKIMTQILDVRNARKMHLLDWSVDSLYRPRVLSYYRGSPGDTNIVHMIPVVFDVATRKMAKVAVPPLPYFIWNSLMWSQKGDYLYGLYHHRGYKQMDVIKVDPATGKVTLMWAEINETFVEGMDFRLLEEHGFALLTSERSGWNQLYKLDWTTGKLSALTKGAFVVKQIVEVDEKQKLIYFTAAGKEKGANPYFDFLYQVSFDGNNLKLLTPEIAHHEVVLSPEKNFFVDNYSSATQPTVSVLRDLHTGNLLSRIDSADIKDLLATGWHFPEVFEAVARDGKTPIYGAMWKPTHFTKKTQYPIIDYSYTGPQTNVFPNSFKKAVFTWNQPLAEMGFIVMSVDGLGSAGRSKAFHNWSYRKLGYGLADHVLAIQQLGQRYKWVDTSRVGIFGHSAGGYDAAHALMQFPECYKVAVSQSADHDHRMEKDWWPEMYMGWPVDSAYHQQSNVTMAPRLKGKLLLIHGGIDENVNPSATFKLSEALIKANKNFDLLIIPSAHHGYPDAYSRYVDHKRWNFFIHHLLHQEPKDDINE